MFSAVILAAGLATGGATCDCESAFSDLVEATETHYAGYAAKVRDDKARETWQRYTELLGGEAARAEGAGECRRVMDSYLAYFNDDNLFVANPTPGESSATPEPQADLPASAGMRATAAPEIPNLAAKWTPEKVKFRLRRESTLDPIEGLWRDEEGELAIVHDEAIPRGEYVAFRFSYRYGTRPGEILAFIRPVRDRIYQVHFKDGAGNWHRTRAALNNQTGILSFGSIGWQRTTEPAAQADGRPASFEEAPREPEPGAEQVASGDPLTPVLRELGDDVYYLSLPSFLPRFEKPLADLLADNAPALNNAKGLVVDVRGNSGGEMVFGKLLEVLASESIEVGETGGVLASDWNMEYFEKRGEEFAELVERMKANRGEIVDYAAVNTIEPADGGPKHVVVLQDRGTGGAAETFLLQVGQSGKVVTMGEPSRGNVDYGQVNRHVVGCGEYAVDFGYPVMMRTRKLPEAALNDTGVVPDVRLTPAIADWIDFAERWLQAEQ